MHLIDRRRLKGRGVYSRICYKFSKTNVRSEKISREFNNNPLHQLIRLGHLEIYIFLSNPNIGVRIFGHSYCFAIVSLSLL